MEEFLHRLHLALRRIPRWIIGQFLDGKIHDKPVKGTPYRMFYDAGQHQTFVGKAEINYEPETMAVVLERVRPGDVVFDVGANIGQFTLQFATTVGADGRVISFEPVPESADLLARNIAENHIQNVILERASIGAEPGRATFHVDVETGGRSSSFVEAALRRNRGEVVEVEVTTFAEMFQRHGRPGFVKIDVERMEAEIIKGLPDDISDIDFIIEVRRDTKRPIYDHFTANGHRCFTVGEGDGVKEIGSAEALPDYTNLLFLSPGRDSDAVEEA